MRRAGEKIEGGAIFRAILAMCGLPSPPLPEHDQGMVRISSLTPIIDMLFPPRCPLCGDVLAAQGGLCTACWSNLAVPTEPACQLCQRPLGANIEPHNHEASASLICAPCIAHPPKHDGLTAATLYNDASRQLILSFKHGRKIALGKLLGLMMAGRLPPLEGKWLIIPVPLHRWRIWSRGFNQAAVLARHIARVTGHQYLPDALLRKRRTRSLGGLNCRARARTLRGAITLHPQHGGCINGARVLLIDDVVTSGATTDACLRALRKGGASRIRVACFARVLDEALPNVTGQEIFSPKN